MFCAINQLFGRISRRKSMFSCIKNHYINTGFTLFETNYIQDMNDSHRFHQYDDDGKLWHKTHFLITRQQIVPDWSVLSTFNRIYTYLLTRAISQRDQQIEFCARLILVLLLYCFTNARPIRRSSVRRSLNSFLISISYTFDVHNFIIHINNKPHQHNTTKLPASAGSRHFEVKKQSGARSVVL